MSEVFVDSGTVPRSLKKGLNLMAKHVGYRTAIAGFTAAALTTSVLVAPNDFAFAQTNGDTTETSPATGGENTNTEITYEQIRALLAASGAPELADEFDALSDDEKAAFVQGLKDQFNPPTDPLTDQEKAELEKMIADAEAAQKTTEPSSSQTTEPSSSQTTEPSSSQTTAPSSSQTTAPSTTTSGAPGTNTPQPKPKKELTPAQKGGIAGVVLSLGVALSGFLPIPGIKEANTAIQKQIGIFNPRLAGAADNAVGILSGLVGVGGLITSILAIAKPELFTKAKGDKTVKNDSSSKGNRGDRPRK